MKKKKMEEEFIFNLLKFPSWFIVSIFQRVYSQKYKFMDIYTSRSKNSSYMWW